MSSLTAASLPASGCEPGPAWSSSAAVTWSTLRHRGGRCPGEEVADWTGQKRWLWTLHRTTVVPTVGDHEFDRDPRGPPFDAGDRHSHARHPVPARAGGAGVDGRGVVEHGDRPPVDRRSGRRREARRQHLRQARAVSEPRGPPACAGRADLSRRRRWFKAGSDRGASSVGDGGLVLGDAARGDRRRRSGRRCAWRRRGGWRRGRASARRGCASGRDRRRRTAPGPGWRSRPSTARPPRGGADRRRGARATTSFGVPSGTHPSPSRAQRSSTTGAEPPNQIGIGLDRAGVDPGRARSCGTRRRS